MIEINSIDRSETLRYLGSKAEEGPELTKEVRALLEACEKEFLPILTPRYVYRVAEIDVREECVELKDSALVLRGRDIAAHLCGCSRAVLFAATLGDGADRIIRLSQIGNMEKAVIYDAMASAAIEQLCDQVEDVVKQQFPQQFFTWRFSPGYGDFPVSIQSEFLTFVNAPRRIGLCATASSLLTPKKSVTAVIGLSQNVPRRERRSCRSCNLYNTCRFRRCGQRCTRE